MATLFIEFVMTHKSIPKYFNLVLFFPHKNVWTVGTHMQARSEEGVIGVVLDHVILKRYNVWL